MIGRNRRGNRQATMKARLAIATAVLAGGAAIGAVAVATSSHPSTSAAQSAGYTLNFHHQVSVGTALSTALTDWTTSHQQSFNVLSNMSPVKNFAIARHGRTVFAVQRGVVALATKHFLLVKSSNGSLHLWLTNRATHVTNVAGSTAGTTAMTGNRFAATAATSQGNMVPASSVMAGTTTVSALNNPAPKPATFTVTVAGGGQTITITITSSTATVMPATTTVAQQTGTSMNGTTQPTFATMNHIARGDLVLVAGVEKHGQLWAQLVLFAAPMKTPTTPTPTGTVTTTPSPGTTVSGNHF